MPKIGQVMESGTLLEWHCESGEQVEKGSLLVTIETDKAAIDIDAPESGRIHLHIESGIEVDVGTLLAEIGDARPVADAIREQSDKPASGASAPETISALPTTGKPARVLASPRAKRLASEQGIDLSTLVASAADGVISEKDVMDVVATLPQETSESQRTPLKGLQKVAARQLTRSWQSIPHIVQMIDVDASALKSAHRNLKEAGQEVSLNDLLLHAIARALAAHPDLNAVVEDEHIQTFSEVNVGFAVESDAGLLVPVIRRADTLTITELATEAARLTQSARSARMRIEDMGGASLTVSNLGMYGIRMGTPVINPGESILVFVGAIEERAVVRSGTILALPQVTLSIAFDHRLANGVSAARFTGSLKQNLEDMPLAEQTE